MRDGGRVQANFEAQLPKCGGDILGGDVSLQRTAGTRSNVFGEMGELAVGVVVIESGGFDGGKLLQENWREVLLVVLAVWLRSHHCRSGLWRLRWILGAGNWG